MEVKSLENIDFEVIMNCFLRAFENYYVEMPTGIAFYLERWKYAGVDFKLSFGMFDNQNLVGFIINGIDTRRGVSIAFNTGTGVLPEFRRRKIVKQLYDFAIPKLKSEGIGKCVLEVISENIIAIKSYQEIGFRKTRTLKCFSGKIETPEMKVNVVVKDLYSVDFNNLPNQDFYTWDNHKASIRENKNYRFFQIEDKGKINSYFIINVKNGYLAQFDVVKADMQNWNELISGICSINKKVRINNVDVKLQNKISFLNSCGLTNTIDQYEMEMAL